jgi:superfamily II DNA/RNA helicase
VASILLRRACSSPFSLARSLERRMALLLEIPADSLDQLTLPFIDKESDEEPGSELGIPGFRDSSEEGRWLQRLIELARTASLRESKIHTLRRLIQRAREPVLVFTEYRDTLQHLATALVDFAPLGLHGGLTTRERADVVRQFTAGFTAVLLATDAASEGLNLHHRCRLVVNLELPWTPQRLEQRIGRVDRLGQQRRVHAVRLVAMNTHEESMGTRLDARAERIHAAFDIPGSANAALSNDAVTEATRLLAARSLSLTRRRSMSSDRPFVTFIKTRSGGTSRIWAFRLSCVDEAGHLLFETVAGLRDQRGGCRIDEELDRIAAAHHEYILTTTSAAMASWLDLTTRREEAVARALRESHARLCVGLLQPGLFGRHAERAAAAQTSQVDEAVAKSHARLTMLHRARRVGLDERMVVFGAVFRP